MQPKRLFDFLNQFASSKNQKKEKAQILVLI
jgi:hypothetical protein